MPAPQILNYSTDVQYYVEEIRGRYNARTIITPEGYEVKFFLNTDKDCMHALCGKGSDRFNHLRARHISLIEHVLTDASIRSLYLNRKTRNICFVSESLGYVVICSVMKDKKLKFITQFPEIGKSTSYVDGFNDRTKYKPL